MPLASKDRLPISNYRFSSQFEELEEEERKAVKCADALARAPLSRVKSPKRIANGNSCAGHFELEARALDDEPSRSGGFDIAQGIYSSDPITSNSYSH